MGDDGAGIRRQGAPVPRCAAHPGRPAADRCPNCGRLRCASDIPVWQDGCLVCRWRLGPSARPSRRAAAGDVRVTRPVVLAGIVRAALAGWLTCLIGAVIAYNYVGAEFFSVLVPGLVGAACAVSARRAAGPVSATSTVLGLGVRLVSGGYAVLSALYAFQFADEPYGPAGRWLPPVAAALVGVAIGELYAAPPRRRRSRVAGTTSRD